MEFPISRERLQRYRTNEAVTTETRQRVMTEIQKICKEVERTVLTTGDRKYIYRISDPVRFGHLRSAWEVQCADILKDLMHAIRQTFPDSTVMLDPLETYILIDWS